MQRQKQPPLTWFLRYQSSVFRGALIEFLMDVEER
jgi:hypothetical protein